jgi:5-methylcytosine-specific restriction endonuclease McrA
MKTCPDCERVLSREDDYYHFQLSPTSSRVSAYCRACSSTRSSRNWKKRKRDIQEKIIAYLQTHQCVDCGEADWQVLEFDHRDRDKKIDAVSNMVNRCGWPQVEREIAKCDVRCANCHRRKTAKDLDHYAYLIPQNLSNRVH